ncbi:MAG TPA: alpha-hydroxy-acid oxidizing protein [Hydrogenophaga sp.]|uniref:alpha-hydroxy acid oxidase n=1 Tax=Hydrogenophaga sp. TaxID=1904254 RepID=UPI0008AE8A78|nr:alpha-hydroxy acid oxidase [Hydrogenophaga sp.]OGA73849.1 MAG: alpha-hydroxy-acid oxidizing enzyme [Burkholderiales bacterium GWE1_65_30]OGA92017.1 MAG: alpha-hydroxy-acid oxidizing enzyme [Burkholderiales bacterium GWF1_66_17]HAX20288.1 alpha-hydroxy-acid oxidizing protein [Hydrogenophaga sp.]HBU18940.1 alpha-hydroxy-acid oxidizing protein [Hydrogenophaga sp.]
MLLNVEDYQHRARAKLPRFVRDYVDGAAEREICLQRNRTALEQLVLTPRVLRDTAAVDTSVEVFGRRWKHPIAIAPMGLNGLIRPQGDVLIARAAQRHGIPFIQSTASNARLEAVAKEAAPPWLQLYVMGDRGMAEQLVRRAAREGSEALVLTVDVPVSGYRERDERNGFRLPFKPTLGTALEMLTHPAWLFRAALAGAPEFVNLSETEGKGSAQAQAALLNRTMDRSMVWDSLRWLRTLWSGPLLLKGVLHPDDAAMALRHGVDGLIVSNHGGRQMDAAPAAITALPPVLDAVGGQVPVLVDSGFRSGTDIAKALALGAQGVLIGRPALYGLAVDGEEGVSAVLELLARELTRTMTLLGAAQVSDLCHAAPLVAGRTS